MASEEELHAFDNYLPCHEYSSASTDENGFHRFQKDGLFYFSYIEKGMVILRSEGYDNEPGRENGIVSVISNQSDESLWAPFQEDDGRWVMLLFAKNNQEIARTCSFILKDDAMLLLPSARAMAAQSPEHHRKEDDYLKCAEYEAHTGNKCPGHDDFICFQHHENGRYYFAWVNRSGKIILRSEGYPTTAARDNGIQSVIKNRDNKDRFEVMHIGNQVLVRLKAANHQEIGRSCPHTDAAAFWALLAAPIAMAATAEAPRSFIPPPPADPLPEKGKFNWWWLLPLLLIPLFFLWRSCNNQTPKTKEPVTVEPAPVAAVTDTTPSCDLQWILFEFDKDVVVDSGRAELRQIADLLKNNTNYVVDFKGYTDEKGTYEYNADLSKRRALNCEKILIELGIDSARIQADAMSENDPAAINTQDDSGRHFNRRVEVYIIDATGKRVCKSIKPEIPYNLKTE